MATSTLLAQLKRCNACGRDLPLSRFWANRHRRYDMCTPCRKGEPQPEERRKVQKADCLSLPADPEAQAVLRTLACVRWSLPTGLTQGELDNYAEVAWGLVCDPDYPGWRAAYEAAMRGAR